MLRFWTQITRVFARGADGPCTCCQPQRRIGCGCASVGLAKPVFRLRQPRVPAVCAACLRLPSLGTKAGHEWQPRHVVAHQILGGLVHCVIFCQRWPMLQGARASF